MTDPEMFDDRDREWMRSDWERDTLARWDSYYEDESMVDLGGGMVVPLRELLEDDDD
jgi:hypothetical protein